MAVFRGSRYEGVAAFEPSDDGTRPFAGLLPRPVPVPEGVVEHMVARLDRLDSLAHDYFGEPRRWHRLAEANPEALFPEDLLHEKGAEPFGVDRAEERVGAILIVPRREEPRS
ncbi:MAG: hypothetical protein V4574_06145 [Pseudomonadota bacterium]